MLDVVTNSFVVKSSQNTVHKWIMGAMMGPEKQAERSSRRRAGAGWWRGVTQLES